MNLGILLSEGRVSTTTQGADTLLLQKGTCGYTTARSVFGTRVFRFEDHVVRLMTAMSGLFPEACGTFGITKEEIRERISHDISLCWQELYKIQPELKQSNGDVKINVMIECPTETQKLPVTILLQPMAPPHSPPIVCDIYHVCRSNAQVKDSNWVKKRKSFYEQSGSSVEEILLCENDCILEGGQTNFFVIQKGVVHTANEGILPGTMREMALQLCKKMNIPVVLSPPRVDSIGEWDACFLTSTSRFIMPIHVVRMGQTVVRDDFGKCEILEKLLSLVNSQLLEESVPFL